ncbi:MAG: GNAT family N-acetyltransferase, partial [Clostridia bacterium]
MCYQMVPLTRDMLPGLLALERVCFTAPWTEGMFLGELDNPAAEYRIIRYEEEPVAYMGMWCVADEGQITNIAVSPAHRRRGLATRLLTFFIELARARGLRLLTLEVRAHNQAAIV